MHVVELALLGTAPACKPIIQKNTSAFSILSDEQALSVFKTKRHLFDRVVKEHDVHNHRKA